jgi:hypothetical protein
VGVLSCQLEASCAAEASAAARLAAAEQALAAAEAGGAAARAALAVSEVEVRQLTDRLNQTAVQYGPPAGQQVRRWHRG